MFETLKKMKGKIDKNVDRNDALKSQRDEDVVIKYKSGKIEAGAFEGFHNIRSVDTGEITSIENNAFNNCRQLKTITLPNVEEIKDNVFNGCIELSAVDVKDENMAGIIIKKLTECGLRQRIDIYIAGKFKISIKDNCEYLFRDKIDGLRKGDKISVPHYEFTGMTKNVISAGAFKDIDDLGELDISAVTAIEDNAFENCTDLHIVTVKNENMAEMVIKSLIESGLKQEIAIYINNDYKISIENNHACLSNLDFSVRFNSIVKDNDFKLPHYDFTGELEYAITKSSMSNIDALQKLDTNATVIIEDNAFEGCKNLKEIFLPNVKKIGKKVFQGCETLCDVHVSGDMVSRIKEVLIESGLSQQVYIHVNDEIVDCLYNKLSKDIIKESVARSENWISNDNIEIPGCYTKIDDDAFTLSSMTKINTNKVTIIGEFVCSHCDNLKEIYLPKAEEIGFGFCFKCPNLEKVTVKDEPIANEMKKLLISYGENRSIDINIYIEGQNDPFFKIKKDDPVISIENSILIMRKVLVNYLNINAEGVEGILSTLRKYNQEMRMSYIISRISSTSKAAGKSLAESEIESMVNDAMSEIGN